MSRTDPPAEDVEHAGDILMNVQVLQQLVTSMCRTSSDVLLAVPRAAGVPVQCGTTGDAVK